MIKFSILRDILLALIISVSSPALAQDASPAEPSRSPSWVATDRLWIEPTAAPSRWQPYPLEQRAGRLLALSAKSFTFENRLRDDSPPVASEIPVNRVARWQVQWPPEVQDALESLTQDAASVATARQALVLASQLKSWERTVLLAHAARVLATAGEAKASLEILEINEWMEHVPLLATLLPSQWMMQEVDSEASEAATAKLDSVSAATRMVAASWLLTSDLHRDDAMGVMQKLAKDGSRPLLRGLASAQLWRLADLENGVRLTDAVIDERLDQVAQLPLAVQGGPLLVVGQQLAAKDRDEEAVEIYLSLLLLHRLPPAERNFVLEQAVGLLNRLHRSQDAAALLKMFKP